MPAAGIDGQTDPNRDRAIETVRRRLPAAALEVRPTRIATERLKLCRVHQCRMAFQVRPTRIATERLKHGQRVTAGASTARQTDPNRDRAIETCGS